MSTFERLGRQPAAASEVILLYITRSEVVSMIVSSLHHDGRVELQCSLFASTKILSSCVPLLSLALI